MSKSLEKHIGELLFQLPAMIKIANGETKISQEEGPAVYRIRRFEEVVRIVDGIRDVYEKLEDDKQAFISSYYWEMETTTIEAAGRENFISANTAKRWKKEIANSIAKRLGWL